jgi:kynurenine formamidase
MGDGMARWKKRPEGSNWGEFGADDQLGRLNLLTPERVRRAAAEIREGRAFCLSLPLDYPGGNRVNPRRHPPQLGHTWRDDQPNFNFPLETLDPAHVDVVCDDAALIHLQYSTQWDSLAHVGQMFDADGDGVPEMVFYNGFRAGTDIVSPGAIPRAAGSPAPGPGAQALGIHRIAETGVQGRGVLVDLAGLKSDELLVTRRTLERRMAEQAATVEPGDILCLHTGFAQMLLDMKGNPDPETLDAHCARLDGRDPALLQWISGSGIAALVADNYAVEALPARPAPGRHAALPIHEHCLFKLGLPLGEMWYLTELARWLHANKRSRFFLTAPPLRLPGAVGSPVTPVATV